MNTRSTTQLPAEEETMPQKQDGLPEEAQKASLKNADKGEKTVVLAIMDGYGLRDESFGNAIKLTPTPNLDRIFGENPFTTLRASGRDVGLPSGQMGNSEVGHTNIGAGRVVHQDLTRITAAIESGAFFENPVLVETVDYCKQSGAALHLMGLLSDGGVHSHIGHLEALIGLARRSGLTKVFVHCFLDGRDVPPASARDYITRLEDCLEKAGIGRIATLSGRYYAMDRDKNWDRTALAYDAMVNGKGEKWSGDLGEKMGESYTNAVTDEFLPPVVCSGREARIKKDDAVIFFNFRPDRARQITRALVDPAFEKYGFKRGQYKRHLDLRFVCMTEYDAEIPNVKVAFPDEQITNTLGEVLAAHGCTQLRLAETEKYAHVTFFFNGGVEEPYPGEDRVLIPSPKVATYDLAPEMRAREITDEAIKRLWDDHKQYDLIVLNFANCDMVGHTGDYEAASKAVAVVDECIGRLEEAVRKKKGALLITADHGNAEEMFDFNQQPITAHTTNPVPFCVVDEQVWLLRAGQALADIAPTVLTLLGLPVPKEMTGENLVVFRDENKKAKKTAK